MRMTLIYTALFDLHAPLVLELLLLELGGGVELQLTSHPLPFPTWAGLRSDEIISMTFRTLNRIGSSCDMFLSRHCCVKCHLYWNLEHRFNISGVVVLPVPKVQVEIFHRCSKKMDSSLHKSI